MECGYIRPKRLRSRNIKGFRYALVVIDNLSKFDWTISLQNKNAQSKKDSFENTLISSKRKPDLFASDRGKEIYNSSFQNSLNDNNTKHSSSNKSLGAVFAESFIHSIRDLLKKVVFLRGDSK